MIKWFKFNRGYQPLNLVEIKRQNLLFNYDFFKENTNLSIWPVLKANAYGHGIRQVTEILMRRNFEYFVVDGYHEVLEIRKITSRPVLIMGAMLPQNFSKINWKNLSIMVQDETTIRKLGSLNKKIKIHLKVNTGMNRQGFNIDQVENIVRLIKQYPKLILEGVFSHLSGADEVDSKSLRSQLKEFEKATKIVELNGMKPKFYHLSATAGALKIKNTKINAIRLGIGLYGINNLSKGDEIFEKFERLKPVLSFKSCFTTLRKIKKGEKVGYNGTWQAKKDTNIGVVPVGYYEGLDIRLNNNGWVKYKNKFYPIVGRICMNLTMVDLGVTEAKLFDEVEVVSNDKTDKNSIAKMAKQCKTIPYELLVKINSSIRRVIVRW